MNLKVLSWNIWIDGNFEQLKEFLTAQDADIIGLQEVKDDDAERPVIEFLTGLGYRHEFMPVDKPYGGKVYRDGPAVFTKPPILSSQTHSLSKTDNRGAVEVVIEVGGKPLHIFSTHFLHTHQKPNDAQNEQADTLASLVPKERAIVMGDFNATPESYPIQKMTSILENAVPSHIPTWSMYPAGCPTCNPQAVDTRLDYIFVSKDLQASNPQVLTSPASDHLPVLVEVEV